MRKAGALASSGDMPLDIEGLDVNWNPQQNAQQAAIGGQSIIFMYRPILSPEKSKEDGRPRYERKPFIRISQPGDRDNVIIRQVWLDETESNIMADNVRFRSKWEAFLKGEEVPEDGTPLEHWPAISSEQKAELAHFQIRTVEQLAGMTDLNASKFLGIRALQKLAKDFLEAAKDGAVITRLHDTIEKQDVKNKEYERVLHEQAETIRQLQQMVEVQQKIRQETDAVSVDPERIEPPSGDKVQEEPPPARSFLRPSKAK